MLCLSRLHSAHQRVRCLGLTLALNWLHVSVCHGALDCCKRLCLYQYPDVPAAVPAGFFLVLAQPFRLGDKVAVSCAVPSSGTQSIAAAAVKSPAGTAAAAAASGGYSAADAGRSSAANGGGSTPPGWFEGVCEKVDLRYTVLRWVWCLWLTIMLWIGLPFTRCDLGTTEMSINRPGSPLTHAFVRARLGTTLKHFQSGWTPQQISSAHEDVLKHARDVQDMITSSLNVLKWGFVVA
jgi:hypothetical protein